MAKAKVLGLKRLQAKLKRIRASVADEVRHGIARAAETVVAEQKRQARVRTGRMRSSIGWTFGNPPQGARLAGGARSINATRATIYAGSREVPYAPWIEFGRKNARKFPFFYSGYQAKKRAAKTAISRAIREAIRKGAR